ncbi:MULTISPECIES: DUF1934 domain-containing protein [Lactobacillus]|uniref:DUF1934 domain-containing protein n=1 Tax=Lactobacillus xujianguonis TaxID=2495899 RepID=A0A437ST56_9LACO|nr:MULTISPECIES: DUF1934 domain-containing protein [Lactobacillus]RVU70088.1 DUF1934 domain-containing protein [Lactobacillus xujianguonis]RVU73723.1 DUF1934 domain-containing protein [Lactobacillus xujianguonis]
MTKRNIELTSTITQDKEQETFHKQMTGEVTENKGIMRVSYLEDGTIPVKMLLKENELILRRGTDEQNYSLMRFIPGEKAACRYVVTGRQMDLTSVTNLLKYEEDDHGQKLQVEYDLFSGLYLVGNYTVTLIFT